MSEHWDIGAATYPSPLDARDWRWERRPVSGPKGWTWVELNRPEPILIDVHPKSDLVSAMKRKEGYPPSQHSYVDDYNHVFRGTVRLALSRIETDWKYRLEVWDKHRFGAMKLDLWEKTEGYTKSWSCSEYGYVRHDQP